MCLAQGPQRSDAGEVRTHGPSVLSQALYHWATALPLNRLNDIYEFKLLNKHVIVSECNQKMPQRHREEEAKNDNRNMTFRIPQK